MKRITSSLIVLMILSLSLGAQDMVIDKWLVSGTPAVGEPLFISGTGVDGEDYKLKELVTTAYIDLSSLRPEQGQLFPWPGEKGMKWNIVSAGADGLVKIKGNKRNSNHVAWLATWVESDRLSSLRVEVESPQMFEAYVNGNRISTNYTSNDEGKSVKRTGSFEMEPGKYLLVIKSVITADDTTPWQLKASLGNVVSGGMSLSLTPKTGMTIHHLLEGTKLGSLALSPDGTLAIVTLSRIDTKTGKQNSWTEIRETGSGKLVQSFRKEGATGFSWVPVGRKLYYTMLNEKGTSVWIYDFDKSEEYTAVSNIPEMAGFRWSPDGSFIIYNVRSSAKARSGSSLRYMTETGNRTFRPRSSVSLWKYDLETEVSIPLTTGYPGASLHDISNDGRWILFSTSRSNPTERPFSLQDAYLLDLRKGETRELWKDKRWSGYGTFSPDAKKIMFTGGPDMFGAVGLNIGSNPIANNYDNQLYIYDVGTGEVDGVTRDFNPTVNSAVWHPADNMIYLTVTDSVYSRIYRFNPVKKGFTLIVTEPDYVGQVSWATEKVMALYSGTSKFEYNRAWILDPANGKSTLFMNPEKETYRDVTFGKLSDWNFKMPDGEMVTGYIIYPVDFDPSKKYPLIVNYYGGTSPMEKSFGGRYPHEVWSARGYVVYVPQPDGTVGFGQEFSARHQNNWGKSTAGQIIEGTKQFLKAHPWADPERVGCIGASYGGFMTMLLTTQTDVFTCAISHAGISSISSYWGEGYSGYSYSSEATADAYPWNRKDIYVDQSPLFSADKIKTPLLLLHGSVDTNVPLGESLQLWVGLKILGSPVEMVQVEGENHHILVYSKRIEWHNTIMAWFDRYLKGNEADWYKLFPEARN